MNAVGIDVSKGKSTVTIRRAGDVVIMPPRDITHTQSAINDLIDLIRGLDRETKACMEHTGRYYKPVAMMSVLPSRSMKKMCLSDTISFMPVF